ncbi:splicing factor ESS-2 family protein [Aspergillus thermomutatus]|uniref:Nuclear protein DGCR14 n=1 Tax=Aspergillus thermomutatus TaxID=41047 RepID=A0A397HHP1_ASPTH|nr:uncharacterized protein CDV56_108672 [Aspergillus thermomutatus]RHZ61076.1 hypothetical protein CDV56_108672 [Aspergillus thermomutatus]
MTSTPSQALTKRQSEQSLMPPPPPPKRIKRPATVLDEDVYTNALSEIIARDYFPGLLEEQVKQEYLDALESKDREWILSSKKRLTDLLKTPGRARSRSGMTPRLHGTERPDHTPAGWQGDTPRSVISTTTTTTAIAQTTPKDIPDVTNLGLMAFQAKYTSEDNESFNKLLDKQNAKRQEKYAWLWSGNKIPTARQIAHRQREAKRIAAQGGITERQLAIKTDLDARPAKPDTWKSRPENSLMFMPSSIEDTHETISQKAEAVSRAGPKRVVHENTRLPEPSVQHGSAAAEGNDVPPSPSISAIKDAIAGRPRFTESEAGYAGGETPRVNGYAFVDEDEPEPDYNHTAAETSELTSLSGDDLRLLGASDSTPNPFSIRENRKREDLHHRMVDRVARTKRAEKAAREVRTPVTPRFASSPRLDFGLRTPAAADSSGQGKVLTPAAQKLLQRVGSTPRPAASSSSSLRNMWTPTPRRAK